MNVRNKALVLALVLFISHDVLGQKMHTIRLKHTKEQTIIHLFRIDSVIDDRVDTGSLGEILPGLHLRRKLVNLEGGAASAFLTYLGRHVTRQEGAMPVTMHIKKLRVDEKQGMTIERVTLTYSYAFYKEGRQILQYDGESYAQTSMDASTYIGKLISESIDHTLKLADEALKNRPPDVPVSIEVIAQIAAVGQASGDISYSKSRPLTFQDFRGKADDLSSGGAATYCGISVRYNALTENAHIKVSVDVVPAVSPDRSWFRPTMRNAKMLAHEQRHFDITAFCACILVEKIQRTVFKPVNYKEELERLQTESNTLVQQMQEQYDLETSHGRVAAKQLQWDKKMEAQLKALSCYQGSN